MRPTNRGRAQAAGIVLYRFATASWLDVLLIYPGSPFAQPVRDGNWGVPKGVIGDHESPLDCARREFFEETGVVVRGPVVGLGRVTQGAKTLFAWGLEGDVDSALLRSGFVETEYPRNSGRYITHREVAEHRWFSIERAVRVIVPAQRPLLNQLETLLRQREAK